MLRAHQLTPFQLGLATFYAFLFKLTHGQTDLCISCVDANRHRSELQDMIGMFVAIITLSFTSLILLGHLMNLSNMFEKNVYQFLNILIIHLQHVLADITP